MLVDINREEFVRAMEWVHQELERIERKPRAVRDSERRPPSAYPQKIEGSYGQPVS